MKLPTATSSEFKKHPYVKIADGDRVDEFVKKDVIEQNSFCGKFCFVATLVFLLCTFSMFFFHEVLRNETMSEFMHLGAPKHPCPHHLRFPGHPHHIDYGDSGPNDMDMLTKQSPPMDKDMIMVPLPPMDNHMMMHHLPPMDKHMKHHLPPMDKHMKHPLPPMNKDIKAHPLKEENSEDSSSGDSNDIDVWERIANMWINKLSDNSSDISSDSSDSSDDSDEKDFWEGIADIWEWIFEGDEDSSDSSDISSSDNQSPKDVWEQVADTWKSSTYNAESHREVAQDDMNN